MTSTDPVLSGIATKSFRLIRKGFDPEEVRAYLEQIADVVAERLADADAEAQAAYAAAPAGPVAASPVTEVVADEAAVADARAELQRLLADQAAVRAWFGEDGRPDAVLVPKAVRDAASTATAMVRAAENEAADRLRAAEAEIAANAAAGAVAAPVLDPTGSPSWEDIGGHVGRILAGAEEEAASIRSSAEQDAQVIRAEADDIRGQADEAITVAARRAEALTGQAQARVDQLNRSAEDEVRAHVAGVLAGAEADLERTLRELDGAHAQMEEIHASVGRVLEQRPPRPTLGDPVASVVNAPLAPAPVVPTPPAAEAALPPVAVESVTPAPSEAVPVEAVADTTFASVEPPVAAAIDPVAPAATDPSADAASPQRWAAPSPLGTPAPATAPLVGEAAVDTRPAWDPAPTASPGDFGDSAAPVLDPVTDAPPSWDSSTPTAPAPSAAIAPTAPAVDPRADARPAWDPAPTAAPPVPETPAAAPVDPLGAASTAWSPAAPAAADAGALPPLPGLRPIDPVAPVVPPTPEIPRPVPGVDAFDGRADLSAPGALPLPVPGADPTPSTGAPLAPRIEDLEPSVRAAMGLDAPVGAEPTESAEPDDDRWSPLRTFGRRFGGATDAPDSDPVAPPSPAPTSGLDHLEPSVRAVIEGTDRERREAAAGLGEGAGALDPPGASPTDGPE